MKQSTKWDKLGEIVKLAKLGMNGKIIQLAIATGYSESKSNEFSVLEGTVSCQQQVEHYLAPSFFSGEDTYAHSNTCGAKETSVEKGNAAVHKLAYHCAALTHTHSAFISELHWEPQRRRTLPGLEGAHLSTLTASAVEHRYQ